MKTQKQLRTEIMLLTSMKNELHDLHFPATWTGTTVPNDNNPPTIYAR